MPLEATVQDPAFLMQQMHWREELEELHEQADLDGVAAFKSRLKRLSKVSTTTSVRSGETPRAVWMPKDWFAACSFSTS